MVSARSFIRQAFSTAAPLGLAIASPALAQEEIVGAAPDSRLQHAIYVINLPIAPITPQTTVYQDTQEIVAGKTYRVPASVHAAFEGAKLPKGALIATCARESSCNPAAVNPTSKACGLFQLMTDERTATFYEAVYNYGTQYGYAQEAAMVRRELRGYFKDGQPKFGYYPISPAAKKHLVEKCFDPVFSTKIHEGYTYPKVLAFRAQFGRDMTYGDLAGMNNWGDKGWKMIVEAVRADELSGKNTSAAAFFAGHHNIFGDVSGNRSMFYSGGRSLSIGDAYRNLVRHGGETVIDIPREPNPALIAMVDTTITTNINFDMPLLNLPKLRR